MAAVMAQARNLARRLGKDRPLDLILSSKYQHAKETAEILKELIPGSGMQAVLLHDLTPDCPSWFVENIFAKIKAEQSNVVAIVGHMPRLSQLATRLTSQRCRHEFEEGEPLLLEAADYEDFERGGAMMSGPSRHEMISENDAARGAGEGNPGRPSRLEDFPADDLRDKISSKITVSTFLAGFTFTALIELLTGETLPTKTQTAAIVVLTTALALFIVAVYAYDRLNLPRRYWSQLPDRYPPEGRFSPAFRSNWSQHGAYYAYMVWIWRWIFSFAVFLAFVGFLLIVYAACDNLLVPSVCFGMIILALIVDRLSRVPGPID